MLSIFVGSMNFSILTMIFSVKCCKTFSFWFIKNAAKEMLLTWGQVAYYIIVCITTTTHFEPDQVFFIRIHLGCLFNSRKTSTLFLPHCTKLFSDYNEARRSVKRRIEQKTSNSSCGKLSSYFLCSFCWYFHKIVWWFYSNEISNCCVFASISFHSNLPVY